MNAPDGIGPEYPRTRSDDPQMRKDEDKLGIEIRMNRFERARTILYSIIAAGLVSLFIGNAIEADLYNNRQQPQAIKNCDLSRLGFISDADIYASIWRTAEINQQEAQKRGDTRESLRLQDVVNRNRKYESDKRALVVNCGELFPKRSIFIIPFVN